MTAEPPSEKSIFLAALERPAGDRPAYLDRACGGDPALRGRVETLLRAHAATAGAVERFEPPPAPADGVPGRVEGPGTVIGPYKLLEAIGEGGMGTVFMAEQARPVRRKVALKVIKPGMDTKQVIARFEAERQALALMDHPNIARVLDAASTDSGRPYFVMELVRGLPITEYCDRESLPIEARLGLFVGVCRAVQHAHQKGVIHRDLKPSNVLVTTVDGHPEPKVIDFGIAKATGASLTDRTLFTGFMQLVGTPLYMSPEQADSTGADVDTRSDIYSLGVLLYELLTGTTPFEAETLRRAAFDEIRRIIREEEAPRPSTRLSSLGPSLSTVSAKRGSDPRQLSRAVRGELDWVAMKALEKDRRRRYDSAGDLAADVVRYLSDRPVEAAPPSASYRVLKFARRNRAALATVGLVALALVAGTAVSIWQALRATRAERRVGSALALVDGQRQLAEEQLLVARQAVDEMYVEVAEKWLADAAGLTRLQRRFLEKALAHYERFAAVRVDDPELRRAAALASHRAGLIRRALGQSREADEAYQRSLTLRRALVRAFPGNASDRSALADTLRARAAALADLGRKAEAEGHARKSVGLAESLVAEDPAEPRHRHLLAQGLHALTLYQMKLIQAEAADATLGRALGASEELVALRPGEPSYREQLAAVLTTHGQRSRDGDEQERAMTRALQLYEALLAESPGRADLRYKLAAAHNNLGFVLHNSNRKAPELAEREIRASLEISGRLAEENPDVVRYRVFQANGQRHLGQVLAKAGRAADSEAALRRSIELYEALVRDYPEQPEYRRNLLTTLAWLAADLQAKRPLESLEVRRRQEAVARALADDFPRDPSYRSDLAAMLSDLSLNLHGLGRDDEAESSLRHAMTVTEELIKEFPREPDYRRILALALQNLATAIKDQPDRLEEAEALLRRAREVCQGLAEEHPHALDFQSNLASAIARLGQIRAKRGHTAEACELYERAIERQKAVVAAGPRNPVYKQALLHQYFALTEARVALRDAAGAAAAAEAMVRDLTEMAWARALAARWMDRCARIAKEDTALSPDRREEQARQYVTRARELIDEAAKLGPEDHLTLGSLAWLLTTAAQHDLRDPDRALQFARTATAVAPQTSSNWAALALAHLRAGDGSAARSAIERSMSLSGGGDGFDQLILVLALARDGDLAGARRRYEQVAVWRKAHITSDEERYRALEAEADAAIAPKTP